MKCPKCGFHSYAYDNCKKCGADLTGGKAKQGHHAVPPPPKKTSSKPLEKKEVEQPAKTPTPASVPTPEPPKELKSPPKPAVTEIVEKLVAPPEKISLVAKVAAKIGAKFKPEHRDEALPDEVTLEESAPKQVAPPEATPQPTPAPQTPPQPLHSAPVATAPPAKEVRRKPAPPKKRAIASLVETDSFAQGIDDLPDIVSVTPVLQELQQEQSSEEGEESVDFMQRAKEGVGRLLSRFSRESDAENEVSAEAEFSITEPFTEDDGLPPLPAPKPLITTHPAPTQALRAKRPAPVSSPAEFTIDADIVPLNTPPGGANKRSALPAGNALPPLPTSYNSPPPSSFSTSNSLPSLSSEGDLPPLPTASILPTIITATIEEKKPAAAREDDALDFNTATIDPFADDE